MSPCDLFCFFRPADCDANSFEAAGIGLDTITALFLLVGIGGGVGILLLTVESLFGLCGDGGNPGGGGEDIMAAVSTVSNRSLPPLPPSAGSGYEATASKKEVMELWKEIRSVLLVR